MPHRERRRRLSLLVGATALLGMGLGPRAQGQESPAARLGEELFGSYTLESHGQGVQTRYEVEGLLPGGTPVLDLGMPEALSRFVSGPTGYGVASLAYPGGIIVNLPSLIEQSGGGSDGPPYPIKAEAFFPSGPTEADASQPGGTTQRVVTGELGVDSLGTFAGIDAPPAVKVGSVTAHTRTAIEGTSAVSRARVVASDVAVLGGLLTFGSVTTDLVAVHDGTTGSTSGGTTASDVRFLGLDAALTGEGLVLTEAPPVEGPGAPLGGVLTPIVPPATGALSPVQAALNQALGQAEPNLDDVLAMAGVRVSVAEPSASTSESAAATRSAAGVLFELTYEGREQAALADLIDAIPAELKPNIGPIPNPVGFLAENHITTLALAPASVSTLATPPFPSMDVPLSDPFASTPGSFEPGITTPGSPGFATPLPALPSAAASDGGSGGIGGIEEIASHFDGALSAALVLMAILLSPLFGVGSTKLADNVLAPVSTSCPTGHDKLPPARLT